MAEKNIHALIKNLFPESFVVDDIYSLLTTRKIAREIIYMKKTDSTNEAAKRLSMKSDGTLFIAQTQSQGKGRLGRSWKSPAGCGIWMSLLLKPEIDEAKISQITLIAGMAVCRAIGNGAKIKWPNDIVIGTRKACGILTEMFERDDHCRCVICGIGINVNNKSFPTELREKATSIYIETKHKTSREMLIAEIMNEFEKLYDRFCKNGFAPLIDQYRSLCVTLNKRVRVIYKNKELFGTAEDIAADGSLIVETDSGKITVNSGEVSVRGIYGYI